MAAGGLRDGFGVPPLGVLLAASPVAAHRQCVPHRRVRTPTPGCDHTPGLAYPRFTAFDASSTVSRACVEREMFLGPG